MAKAPISQLRDILDEVMDHLEREDFKKSKRILTSFFKKVPKGKLDGQVREAVVDGHLMMGQVLRNLSEYNAAMEHIGKAMAIAKESKDTRAEADALRCMGNIHWRQGDFTKALEELTEALEMAKVIKDETLTGVLHIDMGNIQHAIGELGAAERSYREAVLILQSSKAKHQLARAYNNLADTVMTKGNYKRAAELFEKCKKIAERAGASRFIAWGAFNMAECLYNLGQYDEAMNEVELSIPILENIGDKYGLSAATQIKGMVYAKKGEWNKAEECLIKARRLAKSTGMPVSEAIIIRDIGRMFKWRGDKEKAILYLNEAREIFEKHKATTELKRVDEELKDID